MLKATTSVYSAYPNDEYVYLIFSYRRIIALFS